jgi:hypothetical protein
VDQQAKDKSIDSQNPEGQGKDGKQTITRLQPEPQEEKSCHPKTHGRCT